MQKKRPTAQLEIFPQSLEGRIKEKNSGNMGFKEFPRPLENRNGGNENKMSFRTQIIATMVLVIVGFISSFWFNKDMYYNLAWAFMGLIFFINPVYPKNITSLEQEEAKKGIRIAGMILVFIGLTNGFGV